MSKELESLEIVRNEISKIREKYKLKADKERTKVNEVYVLVQGEKCYTEKDINDWYRSDYISEKQCDKYIEKLTKKLEQAGQTDYYTKSERVYQILNNTVENLTTEILEIKTKQEREQKRLERWEIAQAQGCSYAEWLNQEEVSRQSEEHELLMGIR